MACGVRPIARSLRQRPREVGAGCRWRRRVCAVPSGHMSSPALTVPTTAQLSRTAAFWLLAATLGLLLFAFSPPSPLYVVYQQEWGFPPIVRTSVFAVYALALLASLLVAGSVSDHVGRRPTLLARWRSRWPACWPSRPRRTWRGCSPRASCRAWRPASRWAPSAPRCSTSSPPRG